MTLRNTFFGVKNHVFSKVTPCKSFPLNFISFFYMRSRRCTRPIRTIKVRIGSLTPEDTIRMAFLRGQGKSIRQIATILHRSKTVVGDAVQSFADLFQDPEDEDFGEFDFADSPDADTPERWLLRHYLIYILLENPTLSVRDIEERLDQSGFPFKVHKTKVADELVEMSIRSVHPIPVPGLTEEQYRYRVFFARNILTDFTMLLPWMFTDEMMISRENHNYRVRRIPDLQAPAELYATREQYPLKIMVWAAIARDYKSPIVRVNGRLNAEGYQQIVWESGVIQHMNARYGQNAWIFQQDGASPHRATTTNVFLAAHCRALSSDLHWPAHSPDLNVIENLWAILKRKMPRQGARTQDELWVQVQRIWDEVTIDEINNLVDSFRSRLMAVIALHGESLNGHSDVRRLLEEGYRPDEISALHEEEKGIVQRFVELSRQFFGQAGWNTVRCEEVLQESMDIIRQLPEKSREKMKMI